MASGMACECGFLKREIECERKIETEADRERECVCDVRERGEIENA